MKYQEGDIFNYTDPFAHFKLEIVDVKPENDEPYVCRVLEGSHSIGDLWTKDETYLDMNYELVDRRSEYKSQLKKLKI